MTEDDLQISTNVRRLRRLDCCAVSDTLDKLGMSGVAAGLSRQSGRGLIAGAAITVRLGEGSPPPGPPRHLGSTAIELSGPDNVIVIQNESEKFAGSWGGLLSHGAKMRGAAGVIADGFVRDIDEADGLDFPIFAKGATPVTARSRVVELGTNEDISISGIPVSPGDYVIADGSGVAVIPAEKIEEILDTAEAIAARERAMSDAIIGGTPISQVMSGDYEHMLRNK